MGVRGNGRGGGSAATLPKSPNSQHASGTRTRHLPRPSPPSSSPAAASQPCSSSAQVRSPLTQGAGAGEEVAILVEGHGHDAVGGVERLLHAVACSVPGGWGRVGWDGAGGEGGAPARISWARQGREPATLSATPSPPLHQPRPPTHRPTPTRPPRAHRGGCRCRRTERCGTAVQYVGVSRGEVWCGVARVCVWGGIMWVW